MQDTCTHTHRVSVTPHPLIAITMFTSCSTRQQLPSLCCGRGCSRHNPGYGFTPTSAPLAYSRDRILHGCLIINNLHGPAPLVFSYWGNVVDEQAVQFPYQRSNLHVLINNAVKCKSKSTVTTLWFRPIGYTISFFALQTAWCFSSKAQQVVPAGVVKSLQFN